MKTSPTTHNTAVVHWSEPFVSGVAAAVTGKTVTAPLDRLKILIQTQHPTFGNVGLFKAGEDGVMASLKRIVRTDGYTGLFKGNVPAIARNSLHGGIGFFVHDHCHAIFTASRNQNTQKQGSNLNQPLTWKRVFINLAIGAAAGVTATTVTFPFDTVRVMMATNQGTLRGIMRSSQFQRYYSGIGSGLVGVAFYAGLLFGLRDIFCDMLLANNKTRAVCFRPDLTPTTTTNVSIGFAAGLFTQLAVYPLDVVKRRRQNNSSLTYARIWRDLMTDKSSIFRGFSLNILRLPVCNGIVWYVREKCYKAWTTN